MNELEKIEQRITELTEQVIAIEKERDFLAERRMEILEPMDDDEDEISYGQAMANGDIGF